ncbi:MAG: hypothetical protein AAF206_14550 [Bacteroidota bacterium]
METTALSLQEQQRDDVKLIEAENAADPVETGHALSLQIPDYADCIEKLRAAGEEQELLIQLTAVPESDSLRKELADRCQ